MNPYFNEEIAFLCSDQIIGLELVADKALETFLQFIGSENCQVARVENPNSLRAKFGTEGA